VKKEISQRTIHECLPGERKKTLVGSWFIHTNKPILLLIIDPQKTPSQNQSPGVD